MQYQIFANFRQNHLFSAGDKTTVFQNDRFDNPENKISLPVVPLVREQKKGHVRNCSTAVLGPEMAAPILRAPGIFLFMQGNLHAHQKPRFRWWYFGGGAQRVF